jgi:hypothetical protein
MLRASLMRKAFLTILIACALAPVSAVGEDENKNEVGQEIGAVLAWRLAPETVEEWCQKPDPEGVAIR